MAAPIGDKNYPVSESSTPTQRSSPKKIQEYEKEKNRENIPRINRRDIQPSHTHLEEAIEIYERIAETSKQQVQKEKQQPGLQEKRPIINKKDYYASGLDEELVRLRREASTNAAFREDVNKAAAFAKLEEIGVPEAEQEKAYQVILDLIFEKSKPSLNFNASEIPRLARFEKKEGEDPLEKIWDAPKKVTGSGILKKRDHVEVHGFGFSNKPQETPGAGASNRPFYLAMNLGNAVLGAAPHYGGSYFVAKTEVFQKSTLTPGDTFNEDFEKQGFVVATKDHPAWILANMDLETLKVIYAIATGKAEPRTLPNNKYIELQAFGLKFKDIEKLVLDRNEVPRGSELEKRWEALAQKLGFNMMYYDSKAWDQTALKSGFKEANTVNKPILKEDETPTDRPSITQTTISNFILQLGLVAGDEEPFNMETPLSRVQEFGKSLVEPNFKMQKKQDALGSLLMSLIPLAKRQNDILALEKKADFSAVKVAHEKHVTDLKDRLEKYESKLDVYKLSDKQKAKLHRYQAELQSARELQAYLNEKLRHNNLNEVFVSLIRHSEHYISALTRLNTALKKGDHSNAKLVMSKIVENEQIFLDSVIFLQFLLRDPHLNAQGKFTDRDKELISELAKELSDVKSMAEGLVLTFEKANNSIQGDPEGWIRELTELKIQPAKAVAKEAETESFAESEMLDLSDDDSEPEYNNEMETFLENMNLKHIPKVASVGFNDLRKASKALAEHLDNPSAPALPGNTRIEKLFQTFAPYYEQNKLISQFSQKYSNAFKTYMSQLPAEKGAILGEFNNLSLNTILTTPSEHQKTYLTGLGEFKDKLNKKSEAGIKQFAEGLASNERHFVSTMEGIVALFSDKEFLATISAEDRPTAELIKKNAENIFHEASKLSLLFDAFNHSVQEDPKNWIDTLHTEPNQKYIFLEHMNLKHIPHVDVMETEKLFNASEALAEHLDNPAAPALAEDTTIEKHFKSFAPYVEKKAAIFKFSSVYNKKFKSYIKSAKQSSLSGVKNIELDTLLLTPYYHPFTYLPRFRAFRGQLNQKNAAAIQQTAADILEKERLFLSNLEAIIAILSDQNFLKKIDKKDLELVNSIKQSATTIRQSILQTLPHIEEFADSVKKDATGWVSEFTAPIA